MFRLLSELCELRLMQKSPTDPLLRCLSSSIVKLCSFCACFFVFRNPSLSTVSFQSNNLLILSVPSTVHFSLNLL